MSGIIQLKFGDLNLQNGDITIGKIVEKPNMSIPSSPRPLTHGSIAENGTIVSIVLSFPWTVFGSSYTATRANKDLLKAALHNGLQKFTKDDDRYILAQLSDFELVDESMRSLVRGKASLIAHSPFWLSETLHEDERVPTSGVGYVINNAGNASAKIKIEVTAPSGGIADACIISNETTGKSFQYRGTIAEYTTAEFDNMVDSEDFEVLNAGVDDIVNWEGDFLELQPGNNVIIFTGTAGSAVKISHRDTWY